MQTQLRMIKSDTVPVAPIMSVLASRHASHSLVRVRGQWSFRSVASEPGCYWSLPCNSCTTWLLCPQLTHILSASGQEYDQLFNAEGGSISKTPKDKSGGPDSKEWLAAAVFSSCNIYFNRSVRVVSGRVGCVSSAL